MYVTLKVDKRNGAEIRHDELYVAVLLKTWNDNQLLLTHGYPRYDIHDTCNMTTYSVYKENNTATYCYSCGLRNPNIILAKLLTLHWNLTFLYSSLLTALWHFQSWARNNIIDILMRLESNWICMWLWLDHHAVISHLQVLGWSKNIWQNDTIASSDR